MVDNVSVNIAGISELSRIFFRLGIDLQRHDELLEELAQFAMFRIKKRTSAGKEVDGNFFQPYSDRYKLFRQKHGRPINKVDLFFTGSLLSAMTSHIETGGVRLYFLNTEDKFGGKNPIKAYYLNQNRNFFALSNEDIRGLRRIVEEFIDRLIR